MPITQTESAADLYRPESMPGAQLGQTFRKTSSGKIIGRNPAIREAVQTLERVAPSDCTVLVTGESGTGKELVVAALHDASRRTDGPLVVVNCGAIPESLIEGQLFGWRKGSWTGATADSPGFVGAAEGGTLFLDEVGDLPLITQVKLLRLLQSHEYTPIGESRPRHSNIRVVAATHKDLEAEVRAGRFREDLYFRLNVVHVGLPALRQRNDDIEVLANYFLKHFSAQIGRQAPAGFAPETLDAMRRYAWPGNIRELENVVHRAVLLSAGPLITLMDLPPKVRAVMESDLNDSHSLSPRASVTAPALLSVPPPSSMPPVPGVVVESTRGDAPDAVLPVTGLDLRAVIEDYENNLIRQAMARTNNNKNRAAQLLKINRTTLVEMIKRKKLFPLNHPHNAADD